MRIDNKQDQKSKKIHHYIDSNYIIILVTEL